MSNTINIIIKDKDTTDIDLSLDEKILKATLGENESKVDLSPLIPETLKGEKGDTGSQGERGVNGLSAYEVWKSQGGNENKTVEEFLNSLKGEKGEDGRNGTDGTNGSDGINGRNGINGKDGKNGVDGKSAYQIWLDLGNSGSEQDFINSLKGTSTTETTSFKYYYKLGDSQLLTNIKNGEAYEPVFRSAAVLGVGPLIKLFNMTVSTNIPSQYQNTNKAFYFGLKFDFPDQIFDSARYINLDLITSLEAYFVGLHELDGTLVDNFSLDSINGSISFSFNTDLVNKINHKIIVIKFVVEEDEDTNPKEEFNNWVNNFIKPNNGYLTASTRRLFNQNRGIELNFYAKSQSDLAYRSNRYNIRDDGLDSYGGISFPFYVQLSSDI